MVIKGNTAPDTLELAWHSQGGPGVLLLNKIQGHQHQEKPLCDHNPPRCEQTKTMSKPRKEMTKHPCTIPNVCHCDFCTNSSFSFASFLQPSGCDLLRYLLVELSPSPLLPGSIHPNPASFNLPPGLLQGFSNILELNAPLPRWVSIVNASTSYKEPYFATTLCSWWSCIEGH